MRNNDLPNVGGMAPMMQPQNDFHDRHGDHRMGGMGDMGPRRPQNEWGGPKVPQGPRDNYMNGGGGRGAGGSGPDMGNTWSSSSPTSMSPGNSGGGNKAHPLLETLRATNEYNPRSFDIDCKNARFFVIKSFSEDDIHRSIKVWIH